MKIRNGFVSNSSSSSFACYGWSINLDDFLKEFPYIVDKNFNPDTIDDLYSDYQIIDDICYELRDKYLGKEWTVIYGSESERVIIGKKYSSLKDKETGKQFRDSVKNKMKELKIVCDNPKHLEGEIYR